MKRALTAIIFSLCLVMLGFVLMVYRHVWLDVPFEPEVLHDSWRLDVQVSFQGMGKPASVEMYLPDQGYGQYVEEETFSAPRYTVHAKEEEATGNRYVNWKVEQANNMQLFHYEALISMDDSAPDDQRIAPPLAPLPYDELGIVSVESFDQQLQSFIDKLRSRHQDTESFISAVYEKFIQRDRATVDLLNNFSAEPISAHQFIQFVLRKAEITYRNVHGFSVNGGRKRYYIEEWIEVSSGGTWKIFDTIRNQLVPATQGIRLWIGDAPSLVKVHGGTKEDVSIFLNKRTETMLQALVRKSERGDNVWLLAPFRLSPDIKYSITLLLMLPLGGIIVALLRQVVGIDSYGTFLPILLALSFLDTGFLPQMKLLGVVLIAGLIARYVLGRFQLLMVPRLVAILSIVVITIYCFTIYQLNVLHNIAFSFGLLPIVILTVFVERITMSWEEYGVRDTFMRMAGTLVISFFSFKVINSHQLQHLIFAFPEVQLIILGLAILIGRYNGYKVTEFFRFSFFLKGSS